MIDRTTIAIPAHVRDRLREYGGRGATYAEILLDLMDAVGPETRLDAGAFVFAREIPDAEVKAVRAQSIADRLRIAEQMRLLALRTNPKGLHKSP